MENSKNSLLLLRKTERYSIHLSIGKPKPHMLALVIYICS